MAIRQWELSDLAPFYDLASWLPYERDPNSTKVRLAMSIGGTYRLHQIDGSRWRKLADDSGLDPAWVKACVLALVDHVIRHVVSVRDSLLEDGDHPFVGQLSDCIENRAQKCAGLMD